MSVHTWGHFAHYFLPRVGAEKSERTMLALMCWAAAEGNSAANNLFNTTLRTANSWTLAGNTHGVQEYRYFQEGVWANAYTLNYGARKNLYGYGDIRAALVRQMRPRATLEAIERSAWGTGGLALRVYDTIPDATILDYRLRALKS